ncbi:NACHT domain-containing protein [Bacteroides thetaiotaomicron]|uniref:NACHT domain-containing protein n=1 Tax=Bacteroides thetaiotaomicron TaxID=818 RepID=UPI001F2EF64E|nr:hypothetical protein [Bacteroides thetaiotaomicron]
MEVYSIIAKGLISSLIKNLSKKDWEQKVDRVYQRALARWIDNDEIRKSEYIHKYKHFEDLETYINKGEVQKSTEALVILLMEELDKDPETHIIIADIRIKGIQEGVSENNKLTHQMMGSFVSLEELIKNGFNSLIAQNVKGKYDLPKKYFLELYKVPVEPTPFIERTVSPEKEISFWDYNERTLLSLCMGIETENNRFVILSSGGNGKSSEIRYVAHRLANSELYYPIYYSLADCIKTKSLSDSLPEFWDYDLGEKTVIFFDGLDETPLDMRHDVTKEIQTIANNNPQITIVVTCRSNFYNNYFGNFDCYILNQIQAADIEKYSKLSGITDYGLFSTFIENNRLTDYSRNPFYLKSLIEYYRGQKSDQVTRKGIVEFLIKSSFIVDDKKSINDENMGRFHAGIKYLYQFAWTLQLSESNKLSKYDIIEHITGDEKKLHILQSFSMIKRYNDMLYFEHSSFKELLVAILLSSETFEDICTYICYDRTKIIKPSWYNTAIMLFSFLDTDKPVFSSFLEMLYHDNLIVLLKSERFRVPEGIRYDVVSRICDEINKKNLWIEANEADDIASFGSDERIIDLFLQSASDKTNSESTRLNACVLLKGIRYNGNYADYAHAVQTLKNIVCDVSDNINIRKAALVSLSNKDIERVVKINDIYKEISSQKELFKYLISIIPYDQVEMYLPIILDTLDYYGHQKEGVVPNYSIPFDLMKNVLSENGIMSILDYTIKNCDRLSYGPSSYDYNEFVISILNNSKQYIDSSHDMLDTIIKLAYTESMTSYTLDEKYVSFFSEEKIKENVWNKFCEKLNDKQNNNYYYFLAGLVTDDKFDDLIDRFGGDNTKILDRLLDCISDNELKWRFEDKIKETTGRKFDQSVRYNQDYWLEQQKCALELLFNQDKFKEELLLFIDKNVQMDWTLFLENIENSGKKINSIIIQFAGYFSYKDSESEIHKLDNLKLKSCLNDKLAFNNIAMQIVLNKINQDSNTKLSESQIEHITEWVNNTLETNGFLEPLRTNRISLKLLVRLNIKLHSQILLSLLNLYGSSMLTEDEWNEFIELATAICSIEQIKTKISEVFRSKEIKIKSIYSAYIDFIEEYNLSECYYVAFEDLCDPSRFGEEQENIQNILIRLLCKKNIFITKVLKVWKTFDDKHRADTAGVIVTNWESMGLDEKELEYIFDDLVNIYNLDEIPYHGKEKIMHLLINHENIEGLNLLIKILDEKSYVSFLHPHINLNYSKIDALEKYLIILEKIMQDIKDQHDSYDMYREFLLLATMNGIKNLAIIKEEYRKRVEDGLKGLISKYVNKRRIAFVYKLIDDCNNSFRENNNKPLSIQEAIILYPKDENKEYTLCYLTN